MLSQNQPKTLQDNNQQPEVTQDQYQAFPGAGKLNHWKKEYS